jgi:Chaperone of endosialidase
MGSIRVFMTLVLTLTLGLALAVPAQPLTSADLATGVFGGGPFVELCESFIGRLLPRVCFNTAVGFSALESNTTGSDNTAVGAQALQSNTTGGANTATGFDALFSNTTGNNNTAMGAGALFFNTTGGNNTAIGINAGSFVTTGNDNIHIGSNGIDGDDALIRIGSPVYVATFIAGIRGVTTEANDALAVLIDSNGQLGTTNSSRRVKTDIHDLAEYSRALHQLRPVSFRYRNHPSDGPPEYGLIAEEVAEIYPELVVRDTDGQPSGVRYHVLPAMLLNEQQRQQRQLAAHVTREREQAVRLDTQAARLDAQQQELDELRAQVRALIGGRAAVRE